MLLVRNRDEPGLIGGLGTLLAKAGINIANFNLGRDKVGGQALAMIAVDQRIDDKLLGEIQTPSSSNYGTTIIILAPSLNPSHTDFHPFAAECG